MIRVVNLEVVEGDLLLLHVLIVEMVKVDLSLVVLFEMAAEEKAGQLIDVALDQ